MCVIWSDIELYNLRVGDSHLEVKDGAEQELDIRSIDFHEAYSVGPYLNNDLAIIHVGRDRDKGRGGRAAGIRMSRTVGAVCLPPDNADYRPGDNLTISGWGKNGYDRTAAGGGGSVLQLKEACVPVIDREECRAERVYGRDKISAGMFCAGDLEVRHLGDFFRPFWGVAGYM